MKLRDRLIRYSDLIPCKAAFIDAKTPGSHLKDNYSIIGGGVSESNHQKVNISEKHGFCIGAAGQPPRIRNSSHSHFTAEVFMVYSGTWRFYWNFDEGMEVILHPGDIISLPTNMFRGFENVGDEYGMIFSILGHDDVGGGVVWSPKVIEEARGHGLILMENGKLVDTTINETIPPGMKQMPILTEAGLSSFDEYTVEQMRQHVGHAYSYAPSVSMDLPNQSHDTMRWFDILGPLDSKEHKFQVKPGDPNGDQFNVYGLQSDLVGDTGAYSRNDVEVMIVYRGEFDISCIHEGESIHLTLKDGDIFTFPKGAERRIKALKYGFAYFVVGGDYPASPTKL